jgi:lipoate-protein ligase A
MLSFLGQTLDTPEGNLALDEALLLEAESGRGGEVLRIWELPSYAVVVGSAGIVREEVKVRACEDAGVPILRRASGGGAVVLGPGCLLFSLVLAYERAAALGDVSHSYGYILNRMAAALSGKELVARAGTSDLAVENRKVSGNSQRRMRTHLLHHGALLYDFDLSQLQRYLHLPRRQPAYRAERGHEDFVVNLELTGKEIVARLRKAWEAEVKLQHWPKAAVEELVRMRYGDRNWTWRR